MAEGKKRNNLIWTFAFLGIVSVIFLIFLSFNKLYFSSNDDLLLRSIMSGDYSSKPDAHLVYMMYPLGILFKALYSINAFVPWYEIFTICLHIISVSLIADCFSEEFRKAPYLMACLAVFVLGLHLPHIFASQYTELSGICAASAIACIMAGRRNTAAVMSILSFLIRSQVFLMALPIIVLALYFDLFSEKVFKVLKLLPYIIACLLMIVSFAAEKSAYSGSEWKAYNEFNSVRTKIYDYGLLPQFESNSDIYEELGLGADEYTALVEYDLSAVENISTGTLKALADRQKTILENWKQYYNVFNKEVKDTFASLIDNLKTVHGAIALLMMCIFIAASLVKLIKKRFVPGIVLSVLTALYYLAFIALFSYLGRLPERVIYGLDIMVIIFITGAMLKIWKAEELLKKAGKKVTVPVFIAAAVAVFALGAFSLIKYENKASDLTASYKEVLNLIAKDSGSTYFVDTNVFEHLPGEMGREQSGKEFVYEPVNLVKMSDWLYESPLRKEKYKYLGINGMFEEATDSDVYIVLSANVSNNWLKSIFSKRGKELLLSAQMAGCDIYKIGRN